MQSNMILGGLAAAQALAVIGVWTWSAVDTTPETIDLIPISPLAIDEIAILSDPQTGEPDVRLFRTDDGWRIDGSDGAPADPAKVEDLLENLGQEQGRTPVATSATSHGQLGVSDADFTRRVQLTTSTGVTTLTLGSGRNPHLRVDDDPRVWRAKHVSPWSLKTRAVDWLDQPYLEIDTDALETLSLPTDEGPVRLARVDGLWHLDPPIEGLAVEQELVDGALGQLASIRAAGLPDDVNAPVTGLSVSWSVANEGQSHLGSLQLSPEHEGWHTLRAKDRPFAVTVRAGMVNQITSISRGALLVPDESTGDTEGELP